MRGNATAGNGTDLPNQQQNYHGGHDQQSHPRDYEQANPGAGTRIGKHNHGRGASRNNEAETAGGQGTYQGMTNN